MEHGLNTDFISVFNAYPSVAKNLIVHSLFP